MENHPNRKELSIDSNQDVAIIITEALLCVYNSEADLEVDDIVDCVWVKTGFDSIDCDQLVCSMFEGNPTYLMQSSKEGRKTVLGAEGLWLIENCFMNGEENIDPIYLAEKMLAKTRFNIENMA